MAVAAPLSAEDIASLEAAGLGHIGAKVRALLDRQALDRHEIEWRDAKIEKLTFEMAQLRRVKFGKKSEQLDAEQKALFESPRVSRRLNTLRGLSHEQVEQVLARGA